MTKQMRLFCSVDDEDGEVCSICGCELTDQNRAGSRDDPMCNEHHIAVFMLTAWVCEAGGTKDGLRNLMENTPNYIMREIKLHDGIYQRR